MSLAGQYACELRREAQQLRAMNLNGLADDRERLAALFGRVEECEEYRGPGYRERDEFKRGDPGHPDNDMGM